jgi:uncharacterized membrane protein YfhO
VYCLACGIKDVKELNQVKIEKNRCNYNVQNSKHIIFLLPQNHGFHAKKKVKNEVWNRANNQISLNVNTYYRCLSVHDISQMYAKVKNVPHVVQSNKQLCK